jgi:hypothetical protein
MKAVTSAVFLLVFLFISGCAVRTHLIPDSLTPVSFGQSPQEVTKNLQLEPDFSTTTSYLGKEYFVQYYRLQTGSHQDTSMTCTQYGCLPIFVTVPDLDHYYFIYVNDQLIRQGLQKEVFENDQRTQAVVARQAYKNFQAHLQEIYETDLSKDEEL